MGQYYKAVFLDSKNRPLYYASSYDFGNGAKLMEHSWMKNPFVGFVERQLLKEPLPIVWAGDYADNEEGLEENLYHISKDYAIKVTHNEVVKDKYKHKFKTALPKKFKYLINYDKKKFVDKTKVPNGEDPRITGAWMIHPLPLLTCEGNGRGGGDFRDLDPSGLIGSWSRDTIGVSSTKPEGFEEVIFDLIEGN